ADQGVSWVRALFQRCQAGQVCECQFLIERLVDRIGEGCGVASNARLVLELGLEMPDLICPANREFLWQIPRDHSLTALEVFLDRFDAPADGSVSFRELDDAVPESGNSNHWMS